MNDNLARAYDALLIIRYQAGSDEAMEELIGRHARSVRIAVVKRLGGECVVVDDVTQEIWIQVIGGLARLNNPITWQAWLYQIVNRQVALFFRRRERAVVPIEAAFEVVTVTDQRSREDIDIGVHVRALSEPYQSILRLRYWEAMSYESIADCLSIPIGTVRSRLSEARRLLKVKVSKQRRTK